MRTNCDITVYCRSIDPGTKAEVYTMFHVKRVSWEDRRSANRSKSGAAASDTVTLYIPKTSGAGYLKPKQFDALVTKTGHWTLREDDLVVRGTVADVLGPSFPPSKLRAKYDDVLSVTAVDLLDTGSVSLHHWKVTGK